MPTVGMKLLHSSLNLLLLLLLFSCCPEKNDASSDIEFHTLDISSAAADSSSHSECRRPSSTTGPHEMEVVDMNGVCGPQQNQSRQRPTVAQILHLDQLRAESIQARLKLQNANTVMKSKDEQANLQPVQLQSDSLQYIVQLDVLGRELPLSLVLSTRSRTTFTQTCSDNDESWHSPIQCHDSMCPLPCSSSPNCDYQLENQQHVVVNSGTFSKLNLTHFPGFVFGCGSSRQSIFGYGVDGVLGLGRGELSFVSQTNQTRFSYCLPSTSSSTGYFTYGKNNTIDTNDKLLFTPFVNPPGVQDKSSYFVDIVAITVGETQLQIDYQSVIRGTVIETTVQITQLPQAAYGPLRDEFKRQMGTNYPDAEAFSTLDTCYDTTNSSSITVPPVSFTFRDNVAVHLDVSAILYVVNSNLSCLAFSQTSDPTADITVFGSMQQRTLEMVFDFDNGWIGFGHHGCA